MRALEPSDIGHLHECCDGRDCTHVQAQVLAEMIADIAPQASQRAAFLRIVGAVHRADEVAGEIRLHLGSEHHDHDADHSRHHDGEQHVAVVQLVLDRVAVDDDFLRLAHVVSLS